MFYLSTLPCVGSNYFQHCETTIKVCTGGTGIHVVILLNTQPHGIGWN